MTLFPMYAFLPFGDLEAFAKENHQWCLFTYQLEAVLFGVCEFFVCMFGFFSVVAVVFITHFFLSSKN